MAGSKASWLVILGGVAIHLYNGCFFLWGNIAPYVLSYFYHYGGEAGKHLSQADAVLVIPIMATTWMPMNPIIAYLQPNPKLCIAIGACMAVLGASLTTQVETFGQFLFTFAFLSASGIGFCYFPPLQCGWEWEPDRKGLVTGIIIGAFGLGAFVFSILAVSICNPDNASPTIITAEGTKFYSEEIASRVPTFFFWMAVCWAILGLIAVSLIRRNPNM
jgi:MFS transporter, OFA family, oxalate/formate antiporter